MRLFRPLVKRLNFIPVSCSEYTIIIIIKGLIKKGCFGQIE